MKPRTRLLHLTDAGAQRVVLARLSPCGAIASVAAPATNWHEWTVAERRFIARLSRINGALRRGHSLRAQAAEHEAMLALLEQLEAAEALLDAACGGRA